MTATPAPKSKTSRTRNQLSEKIRIFAILWFVLVAVTLVCLVFLFRNVMAYSGEERDASSLLLSVSNANKGDLRNYVHGLISKNMNSINQNENNPRHNASQHTGNMGAVHQKPRVEDTVTVAYAVSVTGCGSDPLTEGAAVLKHSIHRASVRGELGGRYNYKMYAIYHPKAVACAKTLESLGYELLERETFVKVEEIEGEFLRKNIEKNGCCGEKEFIKLEAYTLTQHPIVVHLDLDVLVLKPLDNLFDVMMARQGNPLDLTQIDPMWPPEGGGSVPAVVNAFFTRDCKWIEFGILGCQGTVASPWW
jgi:hypothetical protein